MKPNRSNHLTPMERSDAGRMGKGINAFTPKEARWWQKSQAKIEAIVRREKAKQLQGEGRDVFSYPVHMRRITLNAHKF